MAQPSDQPPLPRPEEGSTGRWKAFEAARTFAQCLALKNQKAWEAWCKSGQRPADVPASPHRIYKAQWQGWADFLGNGGQRQRRLLKSGDARPFVDARSYVHSLGLKSQRAYFTWAKSTGRPADIPSNPRLTYGAAWTDWSDWLGIFSKASARPFAEARAYARSLGLQTREQWKAHTLSTTMPPDIPVNPDSCYRDRGWTGWGDWLGFTGEWNRLSVLSFLTSIKPVVQDLLPVELFSILSHNGLLNVRRQNRNARAIREIERLGRTRDKESVFQQLARMLQPSPEEQLATSEPGDELDDVRIEDIPLESALPQLPSLASLKAIDHLVESGVTRDEEVLNFLVDNRVALLWQQVLDGDAECRPERLTAETGGEYFRRTRERFLEQYEGAMNLPIPAGYAFARDGNILEPNAMQRLVAYRLLKERHLGNWSGVGAGKTISAVLASRVLDARLTVIVAANATLQSWAKVICQVFPDSVVRVKERAPLGIDPDRHTYLVMNFESFQQTWSADFVRDLTAGHQIDFIVLDEIQFVKQRWEEKAVAEEQWNRRRVVRVLLVEGAAARNPELRVLGMSATPVLSSLYEARSLLEMITNSSHEDLATTPTVMNAIRVHHRLIRHGLRYRPQYPMTIDTSCPVIDGQACVPLLRQVKAGAVLALEQTVLLAKLPHLKPLLRKGTLVYSHFVEQMVEPVAETVRRAGFTVGKYTGEDKEGLEAFLKGEVDVLIGSAPVGTGVDGLQYVCNRLIFVSLPWTRAEYDQIVGRLHRQGSVFHKVEVVVPRVVLGEESGECWSWDAQRLQVIQYKKTLADAAVDGVVPEGRKLPTQEEMQRHSLAALHEWIARVAPDPAAGSVE